MPSPLSYVTLVSTALSCQRIKSSQAERSDTLCVPWLQIVPDWRSTNMMYMIVSCTGDVGRLRGGHQQDPVRHSRELDHTTSVAQGTSMRIKLMTICVILHNSFMQLHMFVSITFLSLTFVVVNSLYIHGLLCVVYKTDQIGRHHFGKKDIFVQSESFLLLPPAAGDASNEDSVLDLARICSTRPRSGSFLTSVCRLIPENIQCCDLITRLSKLELSRSSSNLPPKDCRASCKDLIRARFNKMFRNIMRIYRYSEMVQKNT